MSIVSSEYVFIACMRPLTLFPRISPRHSPVPMDISKPATAEQPAAEKKPETETELDLVTTPPPVEDTLAARRARRQAIMAKYAGVSSINTSQAATPSPGPSSAVIPPPALSARSDNLSQPQSAHATPELAELHIASSQYLLSTHVPSLISFSQVNGSRFLPLLLLGILSF